MYMYIFICMFVYAFVDIYLYVCIYIYMYICMHTSDAYFEAYRISIGACFGLFVAPAETTGGQKQGRYNFMIPLGGGGKY